MLLHDSGKPEVYSGDDGGVHFYRHELGSEAIAVRYGRSLALSNDEIKHLQLLTRHHMRVHLLASGEGAPSNRSIHRFFRAVEAAGVELCLMSLADTLAVFGPELPMDRWQRELQVCRVLVGSWLEQQEHVIAPSPLLNGHEIMSMFSMEPGPRVGALLRDLVEAQAAGEVADRAQAEAYCRRWLVDNLKV